MTRADQDFGGGRGAGGDGEGGVGSGGDVVNEVEVRFGLRRGGMVTAFGRGVDILGICLRWRLGISLQTPVEAFEEEGGRELCVSPPRLALACFRYQLLLLGNSLVGSDFHGNYLSASKRKTCKPEEGDVALWHCESVGET
jgi:hypothetical protein